MDDSAAFSSIIVECFTDHVGFTYFETCNLFRSESEDMGCIETVLYSLKPVTGMAKNAGRYNENSIMIPMETW